MTLPPTHNADNIKTPEDAAQEVNTSPHVDALIEQDVVEGIVPYMPIVLPVAGGVLMLLLASIAVYLA